MYAELTLIKNVKQREGGKDEVKEEDGVCKGRRINEKYTIIHITTNRSGFKEN